ncbi:MAG: exodeoxyribonuclease VII small subunit [Desulfarculaceae bacterium]|nr:exodeoxyribonuclease VII small subunit [Desulfarculaceae bacterium]
MNEDISFEKAMEKLEEIVKKLEAGDLELEEALEKFEQGMKYSKYCLDVLDRTEKKITLLMQDENGNLTEEPFEDE